MYRIETERSRSNFLKQPVVVFVRGKVSRRNKIAALLREVAVHRAVIVEMNIDEGL